MAVVVVGVMAGTSPAMAKKAHTASAWSNQHKDNKAFGEAIHNLRVASDKTNWDASEFSSFVLKAAVALQTGLTDLAASYTNFEYGVVQLYAGSDAMAGNFLATPRIDPTVEQTTVTGSFPCLNTASGGTCDSADVLHAKVAVRSVNPTANDAKSKAYCRVTASQIVGAANAATPAVGSAVAVKTSFVTSTPNTGFPGATSPNFPPAYQVARSPIAPTDAAELKAFPLSPVSTDTLVDLTGSGNSSGVSAGTPGVGGFGLLAAASGGGMINVTLSCLSVPNS